MTYVSYERTQFALDRPDLASPTVSDRESHQAFQDLNNLICNFISQWLGHGNSELDDGTPVWSSSFWDERFKHNPDIKLGRWFSDHSFVGVSVNAISRLIMTNGRYRAIPPSLLLVVQGADGDGVTNVRYSVHRQNGREVRKVVTDVMPTRPLHLLVEADDEKISETLETYGPVISDSFSALRRQHENFLTEKELGLNDVRVGVGEIALLQTLIRTIDDETRPISRYYY